MESIINRLMNHKYSGVPLRESIAKMMLVGLWGKTGQYNDKTNSVGMFHNAPWRAEFTSRTSLKVAKMIYHHKAMPNLIHVATDGVLMDKPIEFSESEKADGWKTNYQGDAIVVSSGLVYYSGKHPKSIYMQEIRDMIANDPTTCRWKKVHKKIVTLGEAVEWNEMGQLGTEHNYEIPLDLSLVNHSRNFKQSPTTGRQLLHEQYTSTPRVVKKGGIE